MGHNNQLLLLPYLFSANKKLSNKKPTYTRTNASTVWENFDKAEDKCHAICKLCQMVFQCKGGSTSSLSSHLAKRHRINNEYNCLWFKGILKLNLNLPTFYFGFNKLAAKGNWMSCLW